MDTNALNELIAQARAMKVSLAQAEQQVAVCSAELAEKPALKAAPVRSIGSFPKRSSRWQWAISNRPPDSEA
jgi:hypothetical protein